MKIIPSFCIMYWQGSLAVFVLIGSSSFVQLCVSSAGHDCTLNSCYDSENNPLPCMAQPVNAARSRNITSTNTCGSPKGGYCELGVGQQCFECDANSTSKKHPGTMMVDKENPFRPVTWWQSQTWLEMNQLGLSSKENPLKVNITISFGKSYHITGHITLRFYSERPKAIFFEKSKDNGRTWQALQYFARNCPKTYRMPAISVVPSGDPYQVVCSEDYSNPTPRRHGLVTFRTDERYPFCDYLDPKVQEYLLATDVRIRLEYPATDGFEQLFDDTFNRYYYAISDVNIAGRCNCHGHAQYCHGPLMKRFCDCQHNTEGTDCERCKPLFNDRPWMSANKTHANECKECQCNNHAKSCVYNTTLGHGKCENCQNNTQGGHCELCKEKFYRNPDKPIEDPGTCLFCACFPAGITNDGQCLQEATADEEAGQCQCKLNVYGRKCDQCKPGFWGFRLDPPGECKHCGCNTLGTVNGTVRCDQNTGACPCKATVQGHSCEECKDGFYRFPLNKEQQCAQCPCDLGGAYPLCNKGIGTCYCRHGVKGAQCKQTESERFFPALDFAMVEAEGGFGNFTIVTLPQGYGMAFSGRGYGRLLSGQSLTVSNIKALASFDYHLVVRYTFHGGCEVSADSKLVLGMYSTDSNDSFDVKLSKLSQGVGQVWMVENPVNLLHQTLYNFTVWFNGTVNDSCSILVDSLLAVPDINQTRVYRMADEGVQSELKNCLRHRASLSLVKQEAAGCKGLVFSASTEIYNGTLACNCNSDGSRGPQCAMYGGQCSCRPGVVGLNCNHCLPNYYGFSSSGCKQCGCSSAGASSAACDRHTGQCQCKRETRGRTCAQCAAGTFNMDSGNPRGCQACFGYGRALGCTSAVGFVMKDVASNFTSGTYFDGWTVVDESNNPVEFTTSLVNSTIVITPPSSPSVVYITAPDKFLGTVYRSYRQKLRIKMHFNRIENVEMVPVPADVILQSGDKNVSLELSPPLSLNVTSYHVILDEQHVVSGQSITPFKFQSILAELTSLKIRAVVYPFSKGSVAFEEMRLDIGAVDQGAPDGEMVGFVENATCEQNYTGLSCEKCAAGFTREIRGSGSFGRCVLCSCTGRSTECDGESGECRNCKVGTHGSRCELCDNNVQGPECVRCKPGYWDLTGGGCKACECHLPGTVGGNELGCDVISGQCSCNTTWHIGGRRCDRCQENAWNTSDSLFSCKECPSCYGGVQIDVHSLRSQISILTARLEQFQVHPIMLWDQTFVARLEETRRDVSELVLKTSVLMEKDREAKEEWKSLDGAVEQLNVTLNSFVESVVQVVLRQTVGVHGNHGKISNLIANIKTMLTSGFRLLQLAMRRDLDRAEGHSRTLASLALGMRDLSAEAAVKENTTLAANKTVHARVNHALQTAAQAADKAVKLSDLQAQLTPTLQPLFENASAVRLLGHQSVAIVRVWLLNASQLYNDSKALLDRTRVPNPDRSQVVQDLLRWALHVTNLSGHYANQSHTLFQSSLPVVREVHTAIQRAMGLDLVVQEMLINGTQVLARTVHAQGRAHTAITQAELVKRNAQEMLNIVKDFQGMSNRVQATTRQALTKVDEIRNSSEAVIKNATAVQRATDAPHGLAMQALLLSNKAKNISSQEPKVVHRARKLAQHLSREARAAEEFIGNDTVRKYIAQEIEPVQNLCRNLTGSSHNASVRAHSLLNHSSHANSTAVTLSRLVSEVVQKSANLPEISVQRLPTLRLNISTVRKNYENLRLDSDLTNLREGLRVQKEKMKAYRARIQQLKYEIKALLLLFTSLPPPCS